MILSFGTRDTQKIWEGIRLNSFSDEIQDVARRKLRMLNSSQSLVDLRVPPSNMLEKLKGDFQEFYSIRINKQWRIIFRWKNGNATDVAIIDYHK